MPGRNLTLAALRTLDQRLQGLAGFVHGRVQQLEKRAEREVAPALEPLEPAPPRTPPAAPPANWMERVRQAAPGYLDPAGSAHEPARPFETKVGADPEETPGLGETGHSGLEKIPAGAKPGMLFSFWNKKPAETAPPTRSEPLHRVGGEEKTPPNLIPGNEDSQEGESPAGKRKAGKTETDPRFSPSRRARIVFPGFSPGRDKPGSQPLAHAGRVDTAVSRATFRELNHSSNLPNQDVIPNPPPARKVAGENSSKLTGFSPGPVPEPCEVSRNDGAAYNPPTGQSLRNKPDINFQRSQKDSPSQKRDSQVQPEADLPGVVQVSKQNHAPTFSYQSAPEPGPDRQATANPGQETSYSQAKSGLNSREHIPVYNFNSTGKDKETTKHKTDFWQFGKETQATTPPGEYRPWPELSEGDLIENEGADWQLVRRKLDHLRRLEEEQRGSYGTGGLFN